MYNSLGSFAIGREALPSSQSRPASVSAAVVSAAANVPSPVSLWSETVTIDLVSGGGSVYPPTTFATATTSPGMMSGIGSVYDALGWTQKSIYPSTWIGYKYTYDAIIHHNSMAIIDQFLSSTGVAQFVAVNGVSAASPDFLLGGWTGYTPTIRSEFTTVDGAQVYPYGVGLVPAPTTLAYLTPQPTSIMATGSSLGVDLHTSSMAIIATIPSGTGIVYPAPPVVYNVGAVDLVVGTGSVGGVSLAWSSLANLSAIDRVGVIYDPAPTLIQKVFPSALGGIGLVEGVTFGIDSLATPSFVDGVGTAFPPGSLAFGVVVTPLFDVWTGVVYDPTITHTADAGIAGLTVYGTIFASVLSLPATAAIDVIDIQGGVSSPAILRTARTAVPLLSMTGEVQDAFAITPFSLVAQFVFGLGSTPSVLARKSELRQQGVIAAVGSMGHVVVVPAIRPSMATMTATGSVYGALGYLNYAAIFSVVSGAGMVHLPAPNVNATGSAAHTFAIGGVPVAIGLPVSRADVDVPTAYGTVSGQASLSYFVVAPSVFSGGSVLGPLLHSHTSPLASPLGGTGGLYDPFITLRRSAVPGVFVATGAIPVPTGRRAWFSGGGVLSRAWIPETVPTQGQPVSGSANGYGSILTPWGVALPIARGHVYGYAILCPPILFPGYTSTGEHWFDERIFLDPIGSGLADLEMAGVSASVSGDVVEDAPRIIPRVSVALSRRRGNP